MEKEKMIVKVKIEIDGKIYFEDEVLKDNIKIEQKAGLHRQSNCLFGIKEMQYNGNMEFELKLRKGIGQLGNPLDTGMNQTQ